MGVGGCGMTVLGDDQAASLRRSSDEGGVLVQMCPVAVQILGTAKRREPERW